MWKQFLSIARSAALSTCVAAMAVVVSVVLEVLQKSSLNLNVMSISTWWPIHVNSNRILR